jgi:hypothetical protein
VSCWPRPRDRHNESCVTPDAIYPSEPPSERHAATFAFLELLEHPDAKPLKAYRPDAEDDFLMHDICTAGFLVKDIDVALKQTRERQIEIKHGMFDVAELKMRSFIIADIEGNLIQFFGE